MSLEILGLIFGRLPFTEAVNGRLICSSSRPVLDYITEIHLNSRNSFEASSRLITSPLIMKFEIRFGSADAKPVLEKWIRFFKNRGIECITIVGNSYTNRILPVPSCMFDIQSLKSLTLGDFSFDFPEACYLPNLECLDVQINGSSRLYSLSVILTVLISKIYM
ncbi:hypothetical protein RND81_02G247100 [Saponaria officinalis]|uniref:Uncharacterized protein n=1 Tax=Saponaria officinalis TaxID=3572 RepID=A0AAW1MXK1_SAPOF